MAKSFARCFVRRKNKYRVEADAILAIKDRLVEDLPSELWSWKRGGIRKYKK